MIEAGGVIFFSLKTNRICLFLRSPSVSNANTWGFVGGKINTGESVMGGIAREIQEEMGFVPDYLSVVPVDVFSSTDQNFRYYSIVVTVDNEFIPILNHENSGYGWFSLSALPRPLHAGAKNVLLHKDFSKVINEIISDLS